MENNKDFAESSEVEETVAEEVTIMPPKKERAISTRKVATESPVKEVANMPAVQSNRHRFANSIDTATTLDEKRMFAVQMIQSGLLPNTLATVDQLEDPESREKAIGGVIAIVEYGRELKITPWVALNGMHVVQGKVVMGIHMYMGLALKNNILVNVVEDYAKKYNASKQLVNVETTIEITRKHVEFDNMVKTYRFTKRWSEIKAAGLDSRDNYKKRPELMLRTRCITEALRLYAADIFMGTYETSEIMDVEGTTYDLDEEGNIINNN